MEHKPLISVVVPVYNVEKYLDKCVQSIRAQSLPQLEILLVDDGSTDGSGAMCDSCAKEDDRIRVIHKENGGLADARNRGIDEAAADLVAFIDSDDFIEPDMMELLYTNMQRENADVSICGIYHLYADRLKRESATVDYTTLSGVEAAALVLRGDKISVNAVNKLFKKEIFNGIRFPVGKLSEDAFIMVKLLAGVKTVVIDTAPKYYYVHREDSITTSRYKPRDMNVIEAYTENRSFIQQNHPEYMELADFRYYWAHFYVLDKMLKTEGYVRDADYKKIVRTLRANYFHILRNRYTGTKRKIALTALLLGGWAYALITSAYHKKQRTLVG